MLSPFSYVQPERVEEISALLSEHGENARILAGGTDLLVGMQTGEFSPEVLIDLKGIPELREMRIEGDRLSIGAAVRVNDLLESAEVAARFPILIQTALRMASHQIRNRATVVGNLCNASPAADMGAALLVLHADVRILGPGGEKRLALDEFFTGCKICALGPGEWVAAVEADAPPPGTRMGFLKHARVRGPDLSTVNCAGVVTPDGSLSLVLGAVAETPVRLSGLDFGNEEEVIARVAAAIRPIDDVRGSAEYRMDLACLLAQRMLTTLSGNRGEGHES